MTFRNSTERAAAGFSAVELLIVVAVFGILSAFAVPSLSGALRDMQLAADARNISSALGYARIKAKSLSTPYQVAFDLGGNGWSVRRYNSGTDSFDLEQGVNGLSRGLSGSGITFKTSAADPPAGFPDTSSSSITFNSRGIPVSGATPTADNIVYLSRSGTDCAVTVTLTGKVQVWKKAGGGWCAL